MFFSASKAGGNRNFLPLPLLPLLIFFQSLASPSLPPLLCSVFWRGWCTGTLTHIQIDGLINGIVRSGDCKSVISKLYFCVQKTDPLFLRMSTRAPCTVSLPDVYIVKLIIKFISQHFLLFYTTYILLQLGIFSSSFLSRSSYL